MEVSARFYGDSGDERTLLLSISDSCQSSHEESFDAGLTELQHVHRSRWRSIRVMYLTMFLSSVSFSICMSSLYPYLRILDSKASTNFLGWVVASYSVGQLFASPFFGAWSNIRSRTREPLLASLLINILANVLYMFLECIQKDAQIYLLVARGLIGFGAGNIAVVRSYVAGATTVRERTSAMANLSAFQSVGFICGNLLQTAMVPIGYPGPVHSQDLHIDMYSATGLLSVFTGIINIVLLVTIFQEKLVPSKEEHKSTGGIRKSEPKSTFVLDNGDIPARSVSTDYIALVSSILLFFSVVFIFAVFETIITPLGKDMFAWKKAKATLFVGIMLGCAGLASIFVFVVIKFLSKIFNERKILLIGLTICVLGYGLFLPWGHTYPAVQYAEITKTAKTVKSFVHVNTSTYGDSENKANSEAVGCPFNFNWCFYTPALSLWQYLLGTLFIAVGYSTCSVMSYTIYSKVLGPKPQGLWMGWLTGSGSLARTLGPIFVSQIYDAYGPRVTFPAVIGVIILAIFILLVIYKRLVPYRTA